MRRTYWLYFLVVLPVLFMVSIVFIKPSGIYSFSSGTHHGFEIGSTKEISFEAALSNKSVIAQIRTREPFHMQHPEFNVTKYEFTEELRASDYWILFTSSTESYVLIFNNGALKRVLYHYRKFGELETGSSLFMAKYPSLVGSVVSENKNIFAGLTDEEMDSMLLQQEEWFKVFFVNE
jgi:hypothetical protein